MCRARANKPLTLPKRLLAGRLSRQQYEDTIFLERETNGSKDEEDGNAHARKILIQRVDFKHAPPFLLTPKLVPLQIGRSSERLRNVQASEVAFASGQIESDVNAAPESGPRPRTHAKESFHHGTQRIDPPV